jgi:hypothetical protein
MTPLMCSGHTLGWLKVSPSGALFVFKTTRLSLITALSTVIGLSKFEQLVV